MATLMQINERLREGKRDFEHLYRAIIANGSKIAAEYMEDGAIQYITYTEYGKRVRTLRLPYPGSAGEREGRAPLWACDGIPIPTIPLWSGPFSWPAISRSLSTTAPRAVAWPTSCASQARWLSLRPTPFPCRAEY